MTRGEVLKKLVQGLKDDIPFFMSIDDDMNMISADMAIMIWEKLSEDIPNTLHPKAEPKPAPKKEPKKVEPVKLKAPKESKPAPNKKKLDDGKMLALRKAGWTYAKIADEMGCTEQTVSNHLKETRLVVDGKPVKAYPDNDGNLWYWDPKTGKKVVVE